MSVAKFKIEDAREEHKQVEKIKTFAGVYFSVKVNGQEVATPSHLRGQHNGTVVYLGTTYAVEISGSGLFMPKFGVLMARTPSENDQLIKIKPNLEAAFSKLGDALTGSIEPSEALVSKKDLRTGKPIESSSTTSTPEPTYEYGFIEPTFETVTKIVTHPSRIFFSCAVPLLLDVVGLSGALQVGWGRGYDSSGWHDAVRIFVIRWSGWQETGVNAMRAKFTDAEIEAAFKDLVERLVEADPTPSDAITWSATATTKVELVKE